MSGLAKPVTHMQYLLHWGGLCVGPLVGVVIYKYIPIVLASISKCGAVEQNHHLQRDGDKYYRQHILDKLPDSVGLHQ